MYYIYCSCPALWDYKSTCDAVQEVYDGELFGYPTSVATDQLYAYRKDLQSHTVVLGTRGLVPGSGTAVGITEKMNATMYRCEASNNEQKNHIIIHIQVENKSCDF